MSVVRRDSFTLRRKKRLPDGRLRVDAHVAKVGILEYLEKGKLVREFVPPETLFEPESMETMKGALIVDDHPTDGDGTIGAHNARDLQRGITGDNVRKDGDHLAATFYISDPELIEKMERREKVEVSPGYLCDILKKPGTWNGRPYDRVQLRRRYNHNAVVESGRAGSARVRMDAALKRTENINMGAKNKPAGDGQTLLGAAAKIESLEAKVAELESERDEAQGRADALEAELKVRRQPTGHEDKIKLLETDVEKHKIRADRAERALATLSDRVRTGVESRVALERDAREVLGEIDSHGERLRFDAFSDREIMALVVEKLHGVVIDDDKTDEYARARFDAAIEGHRAGSEALERLRDEGARDEREVRNDSKTAREKFLASNAEAWRTPLPTSSLKKGA